MGSAASARGTIFKKGSTVAGVKGISIDGVEVDTIDTTDLADLYDTFTGGSVDSGEITLELNVSDAQVASLEAAANTAPTAMEIVYPAPLGKFTFSGFVKSWSATAQNKGAVTGTAVIKVSGQLTFVPSA